MYPWVKKRKGVKMVYYFSPNARPPFRPGMNPFSRMHRRFDDCDYSFPAEIVSTADAFEIRAMIPGIPAEALDIQFTRNTVSIKGEYPVNESDEADILRSELPEGKFSREITFSETIDSEKAEASLKDGILTLRIPKAEEAKPRSIKVTSAS
jgi:HSP20 family protein